MKEMWVGYNVGCTMGFLLGHSAWQIDQFPTCRPMNGLFVHWSRGWGVSSFSERLVQNYWSTFSCTSDSCLTGVTAVLQQHCGDTCQIWMWFSKSNQWFHKCRYIYIIKGEINSLWPSDTIWRYRSRSTLAQEIACCLTAPSHYLTLCWLIFSKVLWLSSEGSLEIL